MKISRQLLFPFLSLFLTVLPVSVFPQTSLTGDLSAYVDSYISGLPGIATNAYQTPSATVLATWARAITDVVNGSYSTAQTRADSIGYRVIKYTDNGAAPTRIYYMLTKKSSSANHWGMFIYNPSSTRAKLFIQSPHPRYDSNTGAQGFYIFKNVNARAFMLSGTHRCNNSDSTQCDGTTTACDGGLKYKISDQAHNVTTTFQRATETMMNLVANLIVVQPHGFGQDAGDPDLIMSNGTRVTPETDYLLKLKSNLLLIDTSLTFRIAHTDLSWTKLIATTNTQGRYLNGSNDPCFTAATSANGRFLHIEQAYTGLRDNATNRKKLSDAIALTFPENSNVVSGNWNSVDTWMKGTLPRSTDDVFLTGGTTVSVTGATDSGKSISFDSDDTHLAMQSGAILTVTGDFTLASTTHAVFSSWAAGAKIKFAGSSAVQTLSGWSTSSFSTSFAELIVDKTSGKVTTAGNGMRFSFGTSLTINNGTFELNTTDDIETRSISGSASAATITVGAGGIFKLLGDDSYIRSGPNTDTVTSRTGKITVYGKAYLATTSTNRLNFGNIDVESGGELQFTTGWTGASGAFNAGMVKVKDSGLLTVGTTQTLWHATSWLNLQPNGKLTITSSTVGLPNQCFIYGDVEYSRSGTQTLSNKISTYNNILLGGSGTKTLAANTLVNSKLTMSGTAGLALGSFALSYAPGAALSYASTTTAQTTASTEFPAANGPGTLIIENTLGVTLNASRTIPALLYLSNGTFTNSPGVLTIGADAVIKRTQNSQLSSTPLFASTVNLEYLNSSPLTTGYELPENSSALNNLTLSGDADVTIDKNTTVNGILNLGTAILHTSSNTISFGTGSYSPIETSTSYISGSALMLPRSVGVDTLDFLGAHITGIGDAGIVSVARTTGNYITGPANQSIACFWTVNSSKDSVVDKFISTNWFSTHDNGKLFSAANKAVAWYMAGTPAVWRNIGGFQDVSASVNRSLQFPFTGSAIYTASDSLHPLLPTMYAEILIQGFWNGTTTITDTLHAEIRAATYPYAIVESASSVCDTLGNTAFHYTNIVDAQPFYFSIRHRNAITTWCAAPVLFTNGVKGYVFTDAVSKAFGGNQIMVSGRACLLGGDVNQDGFVDFSDLTLIDNDAYVFTSGYVATDLNGDSFVDFSDLTLCDNNAYNFVSVLMPSAPAVVIPQPAGFSPGSAKTKEAR